MSIFKIIECDWELDLADDETLRDLYFSILEDFHKKAGQLEAILQELGSRGETT